MIGLELTPGTSIDAAKEVERVLNRHLEAVTVTE
jgi:hypothetical protein